MRILGIETSCDETAAAVVEDGYKLLSNAISSSMDLHTAYGGVVPEIAARSHIESIIPVINKALVDAFGAKSKKPKVKSQNSNKLLASDFQLSAGFDPWDQIDAISVTRGPGLGGSLLIGLTTARTLAITKNKPLYGVNHVEAHVYANFLTKTSLPSYDLPKKQPTFPLLALIVSGGHSQLVLFAHHFKYTVLGQTVDDAVGEAFDKVAKLLGLPYPGGPSISKAAKDGNPEAIKLPKARLDNRYDFSFSGLKTAVLRAAQELCGKTYDFPSTLLSNLLNKQQKADIAASFQRVAIETLARGVKEAAEEYSPASIVIAGGVAANQELRRQLDGTLPQQVEYTDTKLCTDNAAMVATLGYFMAKANQMPSDPYSLEIDPGLRMLAPH